MRNAACKTAAISGTAGALATGGTMGMITASLSAPVANLGGYATAQIIAGAVGSASGVSLGGTALSVGIAAVGGPLVAGTLATCGVGLVFGGIGFLGYKGIKAIFA